MVARRVGVLGASLRRGRGMITVGAGLWRFQPTEKLRLLVSSMMDLAVRSGLELQGFDRLISDT